VKKWSPAKEFRLPGAVLAGVGRKAGDFGVNDARNGAFSAFSVHRHGRIYPFLLRILEKSATAVVRERHVGPVHRTSRVGQLHDKI
jgi:hypothetical protein